MRSGVGTVLMSDVRIAVSPALDRADVRDMRGRFDVLDSEEAESAAESRDQDAQWSRDGADV